MTQPATATAPAPVLSSTGSKSQNAAVDVVDVAVDRTTIPTTDLPPGHRVVADLWPGPRPPAELKLPMADYPNATTWRAGSLAREQGESPGRAGARRLVSGHLR